MLKLFIAGLVGAVVWQLVTLAVYQLTDDEEKSAICGMFAPWVVIAVFCTLIKSLWKAWRTRNFKAWLIDPAGNFCYCNSSNEPEWLGMLGYKFAHEIREQYSFEDGWRQQDNAMGVINVRYSPIDKLKERGAYQVDKQTIEKAKKIYNEK